MFESKTNHMRQLMCLVGISLLMGCNAKSDLNTQYGKIAGSEGVDSVNGVSVLADMFGSRGFNVKRRTKISPRIEKYDTIVWFPDDYSCPAPEATEALEAWLQNGFERTVIYVGRDYEAQTDYLTRVKDSAPPGQQEELLRQIAEGRVDQVDPDDSLTPFAWFDDDTTTCEWFKQEKVRRQKASEFEGPLAEGLELDKLQIELSTILKPGELAEDWSATNLLEADGHPFVVRLENEYSYDSKVFLVANGSFLLNYGLVNPEHRKLATRLIDECNPDGGVVLLESGTRGIEVSDSDTINHNTWAWIAEPPLRYIVPHFLIWGILFCFVFFPIFGRPKHIRKQSTSTFRTHVNAMAKLLARTDHLNRAVEKISKYRSLAGESKQKRNNE